jgi:hypothetical protein
VPIATVRRSSAPAVRWLTCPSSRPESIPLPPTTREAQRAELHKTIWRIANDLRGSVDGWDFKSYVLGILFYRFISENGSAPGGLPRVRLPCIASRSRKSPKDNAAVTAAREILRMIAASSRRRPW